MTPLTHEQTTLALIGLILFKLGVTKEEVQVALETYAAHDTTRKEAQPTKRPTKRTRA